MSLGNNKRRFSDIITSDVINNLIIMVKNFIFLFDFRFNV